MTLLVIINHLDLLRSGTPPDEANTPLVVDPNRVLALSVTTECLQAVSGWNSQIMKASRLIDVKQFPPSYLLDIARQSPRSYPLVDKLGQRRNQRVAIGNKLVCQWVWMGEFRTVTA